MKRLKFWGALIIVVILLLKPEEAIQDAQQAMGIWYSNVAPALFPFLVLMPLFTGEDACRAYEAVFSKWMRVLFRLPGSAAPAIITGMIAGSPAGAIALRRIAKSSNLTVSEARRIALALGGVSPAYLIMGVGQGLYGSASVGIKLAVMQICIQLFMLRIVPDIRGKAECIPQDRIWIEKNEIGSAVESIIGICGYMVFYSVVAGAISDVLGAQVGRYVLPFMDLPTGLAGLAANDSWIEKLLCGMAIGFTGWCIISQNMNVLQDFKLEWKQYILARIASAAMFGILAMTTENAWGSYVERYPDIFSKTFAISLLIVGIIIVPGMILLTKELFLNNWRRKEKR